MRAKLVSWSDVLALSGGEHELEARQTKQLTDRLIALEISHAYLQGHSELVEGRLVVRPRRVIWAASEAVARVVENPNEGPAPTAPAHSTPAAEVLPSAGSTYAEILAALRRAGVKTLESAIYSRTGKFVLRSVSAGRTEYFFTGVEAKAGDTPVAVALRVGPTT